MLKRLAFVWAEEANEYFTMLNSLLEEIDLKIGKMFYMRRQKTKRSANYPIN